MRRGNRRAAPFHNQDSSTWYSLKAMRCACVLLLAAVMEAATPRIETNVIYGMYSGLALLMEVYYPEKSNGYGIVFISGSGWHAPQEYNAEPLSKGPQGKLYAP